MGPDRDMDDPVNIDLDFEEAIEALIVDDDEDEDDDTTDDE